jgi:hypothetical protein
VALTAVRHALRVRRLFTILSWLTIELRLRLKLVVELGKYAMLTLFSDLHVTASTGRPKNPS